MRAVEFLGPEGPIAGSMERYEYRAGQLRMADRVEEAILHGGVLLVEAGTGTGKTLAYLTPALLSGQRVVVSTGTRNLQDQIMDHDLPMLQRHLSEPISAIAMKGLANYLCQRRYAEFLSSPESLRRPSSQLKVLDEWRQTTTRGDRAELGILPEDDPVWGAVTSGTDTRIGARCAYYEDCFVTQLRRDAEQAQIIVVNHHLFFADLALRAQRGGGVLPPYDAIVFDEAHQIEDVATQFFGVRISSGGVERLAQDARRGYAAAPKLDLPKREIERFLAEASNLFSSIRKGLSGSSQDGGREALIEGALQGKVRESAHALDNAMDAFSRHTERVGRDDERLMQIVRRAERMRDGLGLILESTGVERVAWAERSGRGISVGSSPIDVSRILREELFEPTRSVVLTSATLSTDGRFDFIRQRLGMDFELEEETVPSPFDYQRQAALYLPPEMPDPRDEAYLERAVNEVEALVRMVEGGAFVLCTSYRVMRHLAATLSETLPFPCMVQGEAPKGILLQRFRDAGDGVLFATSSFWEGVDVPGSALRLVVIDKLPFGVPTDPLIAARCRRLEEQGERPFVRYLVPAAALALKQGFGRLIRTRRDRGVVALLDGRVTKKGYGKIFLRSLPAATRCTHYDEVRAFWTRQGDEDQ